LVFIDTDTTAREVLKIEKFGISVVQAVSVFNGRVFKFRGDGDEAFLVD
jgi:hypothetical protein